MCSKNEQPDQLTSFNHRELLMLSEVEDKPDVTQRQLSSTIGVALGLTNLLLKNLVQKGYVRVSQASWKRRLYTLTPEGFSRRLRLMTNYIQMVLDHYQNVRQTLRDQLEPLALNSESRVAIYGTGQFAELVYLGLKEIGIEEIDFFEENVVANPRFLGAPVMDVSSINMERYDRVFIAYVGSTKPLMRVLEKHGLEQDQIVTFFSKIPSKSRTS